MFWWDPVGAEVSVGTTFVLVFVVCLLDVIFFFKQKTAYEMRISDWSSDVCSSDLRAGKEDKRIMKRSTFGALVASAVVGLVGSAALAQGKIGRASCRERVCQYV